MSNIKIKSVLNQITEKVFPMKNVDEAKAFVTKFIEDKDINEYDKRSITQNVNNCTSMYGVNKYLCNALLKYEGLSIK